MGVFLERGVLKTLIFLRVLRYGEDFLFDGVSLRTRCFIEEARRRGARVRALCFFNGVPLEFEVELHGKKSSFYVLPGDKEVRPELTKLTECKQKTRDRLRAFGVAVPEGREFCFFEQEKAVRYGVENLGYPIVVKPRSGSVARHVTIGIKTEVELRRAIRHSVSYAPSFVVERSIGFGRVHRATVIDFKQVFVVKQIEANVVGDGVSTIAELVRKKNEERSVLFDGSGDGLYYPIVFNEEARGVLGELGLSEVNVPKEGERVSLFRRPFLRLGGELFEVTEETHADNLELMRGIARSFDAKLIGIDFIIEDIGKSYREQIYAVLELNSVPCIEMHHYPTRGRAQNVAGALWELGIRSMK